MSGDVGALPECEVKTPISPPYRCASMKRVESELVGLPVQALAEDTTRRLQFVVHAAG